ncbi:MAG: serine/threonine-protein phosphatase [Candidatus Eremiobacteraeota bacterium]|nr:serine/threonine-protein phosphatase [Candidatus Eremiobacteraeota bacterium]
MDRVVVLLSNRENRGLLAQVLMPQYEVVFDFPDAESETPPEFDLVILDGSSLKARAERLALERSVAEPVTLPVLLLSDRRSIGNMTQELWRIVDDVALRPLSKVEMRARVDSLLKARHLSQQLHSISQAYRQERRVAQRFQRAALPRELPRVEGLAFSSFYRPGMDESQIGGDWYDALQLGDGRVVVSIGDVCGSGLDAAVAMANVRQVVRGVAQIHDDPGTMLDAADRALQAEYPLGMVTAFVGIFDPVTGLLSYATAGHPRPLLRLPDGEILELAATGMPLGVPFKAERSVESVEMPVGSLLVLYTDGLTEATRDMLEGEEQLRSALCEPEVLNAPNVALAIHDAVLLDGARDDVAVMTVARVERSERLSHWSFDVSDTEMASAIRAEFTRELEKGGISANVRATAELVLAELIGNVVRHAPRWADITLDWSSGRPVLHVLDGGPGFRHSPKLPDSLLSERGRGLFVVSRLTEEFQVAQRPNGGSHARAVLQTN